MRAHLRFCTLQVREQERFMQEMAEQLATPTLKEGEPSLSAAGAEVSVTSDGAGVCLWMTPRYQTCHSTLPRVHAVYTHCCFTAST